MKRTLATFLLLAGLCSSSAALAFAAASGENPMWTGARPQGPLKPFVLDMVGTPKKSDGSLDPATTFHDTMDKVSWHGHKAMRRIAATTKPGETEFTRWATVVFDEKTLLPYYTELRASDGRFVRREFNGIHVKETRTAGDFRQPLPAGQKAETVTAKFDLSEPAFAWAEGVGLPVLLAVPLHDGFEGSVPVISGSPSVVTPCLIGPCFVARMTYHVVGKEEIAGISGKPVLTWKVSVPETQFFFWIACDDPRLEGVTWPRSAGAMTAGQADAVFSMGPIVKK
ncbi:MAG: hypothetical protein LAO03_08540 [Acidobacteriia bacterium]|nr:hypothetical protein [Terriglobia bacterium]